MAGQLDGTGFHEVIRSDPGEVGDVVRAVLPADLTSARSARRAIRQALAAWEIDDPDGDAELLGSEIIANACEHGRGPITLALRRQPGRPHVTCEVTDTSPSLPTRRDPGSEAERGRGLAIVAALAADSGVRPEPDGKTTWFTLALRDRTARLIPQGPEPEHELEAGA